jgi:hypothetical protein
MQPREVVDLSLFLSEWSRCLTAKYQRDRLYRFGKFDDCGSQWQDFKKALRAKVNKDEAEARKLIEQTSYYNRTFISPTVGVIWEAKEQPGWH